MIGDRKITRRAALKSMFGTVAMGLAATAVGVPGLTSCAGKKTRRVILYFTGTGNSLYIARQLADENTELLSIPQLMKSGKFDIEADEIGIVYPIYGHMPPNMVRRFIGQANLKADYKFAVLTYGNRKCNAAEIWDEVSKKAGKPFDYIATIIMVDNWLPNFDMNEQRKIDKHIPENLSKIKAEISERKQWVEPATEEERMMHNGFLAYTGIDPEVGFLKRSEKYFVITDACVQCGVCVDMCPSGNYTLDGEAVKTSGDCEFCFACIQNCPQKAIRFAQLDDDPLLSRGELNPEARYRNENVSLADLRTANSQHR